MNTVCTWAIAGSRQLAPTTDNIQELVRRVWYALDVPPIDAIATGDARGVDAAAAEFAELHRLPLMQFRADWRRFGKSAGMIRTRQMLENVRPAIVLCLALHSDDPQHNRGTLATYAMAEEMELPAVLFTHDGRWRARKMHGLQYRKEGASC